MAKSPSPDFGAASSPPLPPQAKNTASQRFIWAGLILLAILAFAYGTLSYLMGGPRDVYGFLRYALPQWRNGNLQVGDRAPDARLIALDGHSSLRISDHIGKRPLVLIFGSYT
jgi:hypothetical protein